MIIGLRIDVDTFRGTKTGVPNLCKILAEHNLNASFFFSVGPDNMGRHLWRLLRPAFFMKMLRSKAASLYGWDILLKGTFFQGPLIGERLAEVIARVPNHGHEIGLHAWDHFHWQVHIDTMDRQTIRRSLEKGYDQLMRITGKPPICSAVPAWKCNNKVLLEKERLHFNYNSDCRGRSIFYPVIDGETLSQPQIPVTLPTYDEVIGHKGVSAENYNGYIFSLMKPEDLNVLTIHAEVEGISCAKMFDQFLKKARAKGISFVPLGSFLKENIPVGNSSIVPGKISGREGWISVQV
ncbi:MAG: 4-deoxy-4-formamido-L-arabinose-phosphoundecaprenol deformylase [Desulfobacterales bacterium]|jgi:undecaprenyl phosphate-alpha-L-ara4FN deformylase